ncbi:MAG: diguanylate cyclase [candidate division NC10 bacterium]|nr:diguanylate cyclase [candidate division NC10 bacterium]
MAAHGRILVADLKRPPQGGISHLLRKRGYRIETVSGSRAALKKVEENSYDLVILDLGAVRSRDLDLLDQMLKRRPGLSVVIAADDGNAKASLEVAEKGAYSYLLKPVAEDILELVLRSGLERTRLVTENATLKQETLCDDLTTAYNRRYLELYLDEEIERARRFCRPFSILFFDLDHLKTINDKYGHLCGSQVLREVATLLQGRLRRIDKIFRFGGDEFVITLPETDSQGAFRVAQRLRRALRGHRFLIQEGVRTAITASFGIATYPYDGTTKEGLIRHADAAMYQVKETTRDGIGRLDRHLVYASAAIGGQPEAGHLGPRKGRRVGRVVVQPRAPRLKLTGR